MNIFITVKNADPMTTMYGAYEFQERIGLFHLHEIRFHQAIFHKIYITSYTTV